MVNHQKEININLTKGYLDDRLKTDKYLSVTSDNILLSKGKIKSCIHACLYSKYFGNI